MLFGNRTDTKLPGGSGTADKGIYVNEKKTLHFLVAHAELISWESSSAG